jgi:hypothetical protein
VRIVLGRLDARHNALDEATDRRRCRAKQRSTEFFPNLGPVLRVKPLFVKHGATSAIAPDKSNEAGGARPCLRHRAKNSGGETTVKAPYFDAMTCQY